MAPPHKTTDFQLSSVPSFPITTPRACAGSCDGQKEKDDKALAMTTFENSLTCGWYAGAVSQAYICSEPLSCATNTDNIIACTKKDEEGTFNHICLNVYNSSPRYCSIPGVLCCNSASPSCMTLVWTASPTRSLVQCATMESTWLMQDYPYELATTTSTPGNPSTLSASSPETTPSSDTSQHPAPSGMPPSSSPDTSSTSPPDSNTRAPTPASGLSTFPVTTPGPSNTASLLPVDHAPSRGLSTGAKAGIGVGAGAGMLVIFALIAFLVLKKYKTRTVTQPDEPPPQNNTTPRGPLQENPNGNLSAEIAPPARAIRSLSTGWGALGTGTDDYDLLEGASEVPVDMRGQGVGAVELEGSPVEMSPLGGIAAQQSSQYDEYQVQASRYERYSLMSRDPRGQPMSYREPLQENESWSASSL